MNDVISIPGWAWLVFGIVMSVMASIIAVLVGNFMKRAQQDIEKAKNAFCPGHQGSFQRVHDEREKVEKSLNDNIKELTQVISELKATTGELGIHYKNVAEKHDFNREAIVDLNRRLADVEKKVI